MSCYEPARLVTATLIAKRTLTLYADKSMDHASQVLAYFSVGLKDGLTEEQAQQACQD